MAINVSIFYVLRIAKSFWFYMMACYILCESNLYSPCKLNFYHIHYVPDFKLFRFHHSIIQERLWKHLSAFVLKTFNIFHRQWEVYFVKSNSSHVQWANSYSALKNALNVNQDLNHNYRDTKTWKILLILQTPRKSRWKILVKPTLKLTL